MAVPRRLPLWSQDALADLSDIWTYYLQAAGLNVADTIIRKIDGAVGVLGDHPLAGRARDEIRPGIRCIVVRPHVVFYRVRDDGTEIVRVIDGRRDLDEIFDETQ